MAATFRIGLWVLWQQWTESKLLKASPSLLLPSPSGSLGVLQAKHSYWRHRVEFRKNRRQQCSPNCAEWWNYYQHLIENVNPEKTQVISCRLRVKSCKCLCWFVPQDTLAEILRFMDSTKHLRTNLQSRKLAWTVGLPSDLVTRTSSATAASERLHLS